MLAKFKERIELHKEGADNIVIISSNPSSAQTSSKGTDSAPTTPHIAHPATQSEPGYPAKAAVTAPHRSRSAESPQSVASDDASKEESRRKKTGDGSGDANENEREDGGGKGSTGDSKRKKDRDDGDDDEDKDDSRSTPAIVSPTIGSPVTSENDEIPGATQPSEPGTSMSSSSPPSEASKLKRRKSKSKRKSSSSSRLRKKSSKVDSSANLSASNASATEKPAVAVGVKRLDATDAKQLRNHEDQTSERESTETSVVPLGDLFRVLVRFSTFLTCSQLIHRPTS